MQGMKVISDLLMSVSKAERQEARMIVRQDILRLGNIGVVRYLEIDLGFSEGYNELRRN